MQGGSGDSRTTQFTFNENAAMRSKRSINLPLVTRQTVAGYALPELHSPDGKSHQTGEEYPLKVHLDLLETVLGVMLSVKGIDPSRGRTTPRDRSTRAVTDRMVRGPGIVVLRGDQQILLWLVNLLP